MKAIILLIVLTASAAKVIYAQTRDTAAYNRAYRDYYMKRSKVNKTAGNVLLFGGLGVALTGLIIGGGNSSDGLAIDLTGPVVLLCGLGAALISIPFHIGARNNRINAMNLSAGAVPVRLNFASQDSDGILQPAAVLRIRIR